MIDITSKPDEYFSDIVLSIEKKSKDWRKNYHFIAKGFYKNILVGIEVIVKAGMRNGITNGNFDKTAFCNEGIVFKSIGNYSEEFIKALAKLYGIKTNKHLSKNPISFTSFALEEHKLDFENNKISFKLFFDEDNRHNLYCELFCNINIPEQEIEIHEKDKEYRENIIKTFTL